MKKILFFLLCIGLVQCQQDFLLFDDVQPLSEYAAVMPPEAFQKLIEIYNKQDLMAIDKFKELDDLFMSLPDNVLEKMPLPKVFRRLPESVQKKIHDVYYNKSLPFEVKLETLDGIISSLPEELLRLLPVEPEFPEVGDIVEFQVSVLLQFNGYFTTDSLRNYLTPEMFDQLLIIARQRDIPEATRAYLIGRLMKEAYTENSENFPLPVGEDENSTMPESVRRAGLHLMFSKNPFEKTEPFERVIAEFKEISANKSESTTPPDLPDFRYVKMRGLGRKIKNRFRKVSKSIGKTMEGVGKVKLMDAIKNNKSWKALEKFIDGLALKMVS